jgi:hypothetical protein
MKSLGTPALRLLISDEVSTFHLLDGLTNVVWNM